MEPTSPHTLIMGETKKLKTSNGRTSKNNQTNYQVNIKYNVSHFNSPSICSFSHKINQQEIENKKTLPAPVIMTGNFNHSRSILRKNHLGSHFIRIMT